jgi:hypothetical protein
MELIVDLELLATGTTAAIILSIFAVWYRDRDKNRLIIGLSAVVFLSCLYQFQQEVLVLFDRPTDNFSVLVSNTIATF